jgi:hypothetical protein
VTIEDRYLIELKDLKAVRIDCASCGAAVNFRLKDGKLSRPNVQVAVSPGTTANRMIGSRHCLASL